MSGFLISYTLDNGLIHYKSVSVMLMGDKGICEPLVKQTKQGKPLHPKPKSPNYIKTAKIREVTEGVFTSLSPSLSLVFNPFICSLISFKSLNFLAECNRPFCCASLNFAPFISPSHHLPQNLIPHGHLDFWQTQDVHWCDPLYSAVFKALDIIFQCTFILLHHWTLNLIYCWPLCGYPHKPTLAEFWGMDLSRKGLGGLMKCQGGLIPPAHNRSCSYHWDSQTLEVAL